MKQPLQLSYYCEGDGSVEAQVYYQDKDGNNHSFILLYYCDSTSGELNCSIISQTKYYDFDVLLYNLTEEQYFQLSLVWSAPYNMEFITALQKYVMNNFHNKEVYNITIEY